MLARVRRLCTLLVALVPLAAWGAEPGTGADESGRAFIVRDVTGERLELAAQLVYDHRPNATASGAPRLQPVRWKSDATATLTTADGAFDGVLKLERTDVGTVALVFDGSWRRPTWVHVLALDVVLPADAVTVFGRDLEPMAAPPLAVLERFDPKWLAIKRGDGGYTLMVDDDVDAVTVKTGGGRVSLRIELETDRGAAVRARRGLHATSGARPTRTCRGRRGCAPSTSTCTRALQWIPDAAPMVAKAKFPDGRRAAFVDHRPRRPDDGAHAGGAGVRAQRQADVDVGPLAHQLRITKSLFAHGTDRPQLESPEVVKLADQLYEAGSEIVPHSATPKRDERPVTMAALDTFARWQARTWIDHQPETNCEAFGDQGFRSSGKFAIADLLAAHGYDYVWAEVDLEPGPLNLLRADRLGQRAPTLWPIGRLDLGGPSGLWMFRSQWAFLEAKHFYNMYSAAALDRLERERGLHIAHTYLETYHPPHTKFGMKNLIVPVDAHEKAGGAGPVKLAPEFERLLASLQARQERGTLWMPTLAALGDRLRAVAEMRADGRRRSPRAGADAGAGGRRDVRRRAARRAGARQRRAAARRAHGTRRNHVLGRSAGRRQRHHRRVAWLVSSTVRLPEFAGHCAVRAAVA